MVKYTFIHLMNHPTVKNFNSKGKGMKSIDHMHLQPVLKKIMQVCMQGKTDNMFAVRAATHFISVISLRQCLNQ